MSVIRKSTKFMGGVPVNQIVLRREGDVEYYKSVPQTNFEMLGLNIRKDLKNTHCYLYKDGREVDKDLWEWSVPPDCLLRTTASPEHPLYISLSESVSTFSSAATASEISVVDIDRFDRTLRITPEREGVVFFVAFTGGYKDWKPELTASYSYSSSYGQSGAERSPPTGSSNSSGISTQGLG